MKINFFIISCYVKVGRLQVQLEETSDELSEVSESKAEVDRELIFIHMSFLFPSGFFLCSSEISVTLYSIVLSHCYSFISL